MLSSKSKIIIYTSASIFLIVAAISLFIRNGILIAGSSDKPSAQNVARNEAPSSNETAPQNGFMAPDFTFSNINGKPVSLSQHKGKVIFLNIWATWCGPCRIEMPAMEKLYQKFKKEDFEILAVSIDRQGESVTKPFAKEMGLTFPILHSPDGRIQKIYMVRALPSSFIIDKKGRIVARITGARDWFGSETIETFEHLIHNT